MADFKQNYFQKRTKDKGPRSNNRISSPDVQVITSDGENLGVLHTNEAISMAKNQGLDLIEIAPNANPPVCKIMDMGKYKYDAQKKANLAKKKQKIISLKEIKMRPVTETHDYEFKVKNAKKFIAKGDKVKFTIRFKGRELQHSSLGNELMEKIKQDMEILKAHLQGPLCIMKKKDEAGKDAKTEEEMKEDDEGGKEACQQLCLSCQQLPASCRQAAGNLPLTWLTRGTQVS